MSATILIDDREKDKKTGNRNKVGRESIENYFKPFVEKYYAKDINLVTEVRRLTKTDYSIMYNTASGSHLVMCIERKTLADLAASLSKDRLGSQIRNMKETKQEHDCDLLLIIEANTAFPKKTTTYGRIPYNQLIAKLRHVLIRDKIPWIITKNQEHTAEMICDLAADYVRLINDGKITLNGVEGSHEVPKILTEKVHDSDEIITLKMWCSIPGLQEYIALKLREMYNISEIILGDVDIEDIASLKYASGVSVGPKRAKKMINAVSQIQVQAKVLSQIPGVSIKTAENILSQITWNDLINMDVEELQLINRTAKTKIGPSLANKIKKFVEGA